MLWQEIVRLSLLGTERATFSPAVAQFLEKWELDNEDEANAILLNLIATLGTAKRLKLPVKDVSTSDSRPDFKEDLPDSSKAALSALKLILEGPYEKALPEFINLLEKNRQLLPKVYLPEIFNWSLQNRKYWPSLKPYIGKFGHWLLEQNPDWAGLSDEDTSGDWQNLSKEEKLKLFTSLRKTDAGKARKLLEGSWEKEHYKDKQALLKQMAVGLSSADEPFLSIAQNDSRKEVRTAATDLLTHLPESALSKELFAVFSPFVEKHPTYLAINTDKKVPPPDYSAYRDIRDGDIIAAFFANHPINVPLSGNSLRLSRIAYLIGRIHPDKWLEHLEMEEGEMLYFIRRGTQKREWAVGLIDAYLRFKPNNWTKPLLTFWLENAGEYIWSEIPMDKFAKTLSREQVEYAIAFKRANKGFMIEEKSPEAVILLHNERPWSTKLTNYILQNFRSWVNEVNTIRWDMFHYQEILRAAAYRVSTEPYDTLRQNWYQAGAGWQMWGNEMEAFFSIMEFRKDMQKGLASSF